MNAPSGRLPWAPVARVLALSAVVATLLSLAFDPRPAVFEEDERDYLRAASHLARYGVFSHASLDSPSVPAPDAYREPGYSFLMAAAWKVARCAPPASEGALEVEISSGSCTGRATRTLNLLLLATAMLGAAAAVRGAGGSAAAALGAALLVAASPALRLAAVGVYSENLATPLLVSASALGAALFARRSRGLALAAALVAGVAPLARSSLIVLPVAFVLLLPFAVRRLGLTVATRRWTVALLVLCTALPGALWTARNSALTGHAVLADRGGAVLAIRAELDRQVGAEGTLPALLAWTPLDSARALGRRLAPDSSFERYEWSGNGNFFTRAIRRWREGRAGSSDPLQADRRLARESLAEFARRPLDHARATLAVAWRGLFAERSPRWLAPYDLALPLGVALATAFLWVSFRAVRRRDAALLALLLPAVLLFAAHAFSTEFLPRFAVPALPVAWAAMVLAFSRPDRTRRDGSPTGTI
jgi:hypothetical protein